MQERVTIAQIVDNIEKLSEDVNPSEFLYEFLNCFGVPRATIARLKAGSLNVARKEGCTLLKTKVYFEPSNDNSGQDCSPHRLLEAAKSDRQIAANRPRFLIATDFKTLSAFDTKNQESVEFPIDELPEKYTFFLPLAGMEPAALRPEADADVRAAEEMAKLYDLICVDNPPRTRDQRHTLNVFLTRLLFCFFAEDTGIFPHNAFTGAVSQLTQSDGSDLSRFLESLFLNLNLETSARKQSAKHFAAFPYVNGGLFSDTHARHSAVPRFTAKSRRKLIDLGAKSWSEINPDIFGSMFQSVADDEKRAELGMHYTSVPNIMKVIGPLFLDDLQNEFTLAKGSEAKLRKLLNRIAHLRIFDPACGSGNFLIITYKELRRLETAALKELIGLGKKLPDLTSRLHVSQFYGIDTDDFACEIAVLGLWLAEHQMNLKCKEAIGHAPASVPLQSGANVICGCAIDLDWNEVCPAQRDHEVFVLGNPPYCGARNQSEEQKGCVERAFEGAAEHKDADFITCWFIKGGAYVAANDAKLAFVSTNSVCQGDHVGILWPRLLKQGLEIGFAYTAFKWTNNAKAKAAVTCVIVGLRNTSAEPKWLYSATVKTCVPNINPYLANAANVIVGRTKEPLTERPRAALGSMARDGGFLILSNEEKKELTVAYPESKAMIRPLIGTQEFVEGPRRWCLWITDHDLARAKRIPPIAKRIKGVLTFRKDSKAKTTNQYATIPHQFAQRAHKPGVALMIPRISSERRPYIPMAYFSDEPIISDSAIAIYGAPCWLFGILSSRMHLVWARAVAGGLGTAPRYSKEIVYNNFPLPELSSSAEALVTRRAEDILLEREKHPSKLISELYDPDTMPAELLAAHQALDVVVEKAYRTKAFQSDDERLAYLFAQYARLSAGSSK